MIRSSSACTQLVENFSTKNTSSKPATLVDVDKYICDEKRMYMHVHACTNLNKVHVLIRAFTCNRKYTNIHTHSQRGYGTCLCL